MTTAYANEIDTSEMDDDEIDALVEDITADLHGNLPPELAQGIADKLVQRAGEYSNTGDYRTIYSTLDGSPSSILEYMVPKVLKMRRVDNPRLRRFSLVQKVPWKLGTYKCELHLEHPLYQEYVELGFTEPCRKSTLKSELNVRRHMEKKHKDEYATRQQALQKIETTKYQTQAEEDRAFQRKLMERLVAMQEGNQPRDLPLGRDELPFETESFQSPETVQVMDYDDFVKQDAEEAHMAPAPIWYEGLSNKQLRMVADNRGIKLSTKYISNTKLIKMIEEANG